MEAISLDKKTTVYLTSDAFSVKSGKRKAGDPVELHPKQAEHWVATGKATVKADSETSKTKQK